MGWVARASGIPALEPAATAILERLTPMQAPKGTVLFHPGETVKGFVIVLSGRVEIFLTGPSGREILLYAVEPGQSCIQSTLGLMGGEDYSGEAITERDSELVLVPRDTFLHLMGVSNIFRDFVFQAFALRLQSMMHLLERVAFQRVECRLAARLLKLSRETPVIHATHADLAIQIGSAREVISRRFEAWARKGWIKTGRGTVELLDHDALEQLAGSDS